MIPTKTHSLNFIIPSSASVQRLFHGRGQIEPEYSHVCIDWYSPVILITLYREVLPNWLENLSREIQSKIDGCDSIFVQYRNRERAPVECIFGDISGNISVEEHGLKYQMNLTTNQNHGLFLDMANGRQWVLENSQNKRVLNLFSYTCAFSVCAVAGGATSVMNLDMSKRALSIGRENHKLNGHELSRIKYTAVNLFKSWGKLRRERKFDLLICDPPSFQKGSVDIVRDYKKIVKRIPEFMQKNSDLLLCYNSPELGPEFILDIVAEYCPDCTFKQRIENPSVFQDVDKNKGLKVMRFSYDGEK
jgi:23S rRNA (cytosine1962-C5)-methyltransferase